MQKLLIIGIIMLSTLSVFYQTRTARGFVLDKDSRAALKGIVVSVADTSIIALTNVGGEFSIEVPKRRKSLLFSGENYVTRKIELKPGFHHKKYRIYLQTISSHNKYAEKTIKNDSLILKHKNTISLSIIELFSVAISPRYERFLAFRHSLGLHASFYVNGRTPYIPLGSEYDTYNNYHGFKLAPAYRFYPVRGTKLGVFLEGKIQVGYFDFSQMKYEYGSSSSPRGKYVSQEFWTVGGGFSLGIMLILPKSKHGLLNISVGYQYLPLNAAEAIYQDVGSTILKYTPATHYWYRGGPGSYVDLKVTIGGIF